MIKYFKEHPNSINESYSKHLFFAVKTGGKVLAIGIACILHGLFPFVLTDFASKRIIAMSEKFKKRNVSHE